MKERKHKELEREREREREREHRIDDDLTGSGEAFRNTGEPNMQDPTHVLQPHLDA